MSNEYKKYSEITCSDYITFEALWPLSVLPVPESYPIQMEARIYCGESVKKEKIKELNPSYRNKGYWKPYFGLGYTWYCDSCVKKMQPKDNVKKAE